MEPIEVHEYFGKMEVDELQYWKGAIEALIVKEKLSSK